MSQEPDQTVGELLGWFHSSVPGPDRLPVIVHASRNVAEAVSPVSLSVRRTARTEIEDAGGGSHLHTARNIESES